MESAKKIIPFILVAIVFAVGGYFVGHSTLNNQGAALYKSPKINNSIYVMSGDICWSVTIDGGHATSITPTPLSEKGCLNAPMIPNTSTLPQGSTTVKLTPKNQ